MTRRRSVPKDTSRGSVSVPERLRLLDAMEPFAVLATDEAGKPYTSLVAFALSPDLTKALFATPRSTRKYKNIVKGKHVAMLLDDRSRSGRDLLRAEAITIVGSAVPLRRGKVWDKLSAVFVKKHPELKEFVRSSTTALVCLDIEECVHVSRFQSVSVWRVGEQT